jgi:hypothetical protein
MAVKPTCVCVCLCSEIQLPQDSPDEQPEERPSSEKGTDLPSLSAALKKKGPPALGLQYSRGKHVVLKEVGL